MKFRYTTITVKCPNVSALTWNSDDLIDVPSGRTVRRDGTISPAKFSRPFPFDRALCVQGGETLWTLAYMNRGTKAVLFKNGIEHRELNRSYYFADAYDYPIALTNLPTGRVVVVHCPNAFNIVEYEDAESGQILWSKKTDGMEFHSRLSISPNGRFLLSAGWYWHPIGGAWLCALANDSTKQNSEVVFSFGAEIDSAVFLDNDHVVISSTNEIVNEEIPRSGLGPMQLGVWSIAKEQWVSTVPIVCTTGIMMPWCDWVISFYEHPKAIDIRTGEVVQVWKDFYSGRQVGSIELGDPPPAIALNPDKGMFAVRDGDNIHIVTLLESQ